MSDWSEGTNDVPATTEPVTDTPSAFSLGSVVTGAAKGATRLADAARSYLGNQSGLLGSMSRLSGLGILPGGLSGNSKKSMNVGDVAAPALEPLSFDSDWRVRLLLPSGIGAALYSQALLSPLANDRGVIFPYTPNITVSYTADWQAQKLTHSNYASQFYNSSEIQDITIQGTFTAQNQAEAEYLLAVLTFGKIATKMFFGDSKTLTGNPPPIVHLYGHGTYQWNRVPVVIKNFQYNLPSEVDYIAVMKNSRPVARVPTVIDNISFTVAPVYSRKQMTTYGYEQFASGALIEQGFI